MDQWGSRTLSRAVVLRHEFPHGIKCLRGRYWGFRAQISGKAMNLVPYDAGDTPQACVRAIALRHAEALEGFLTTQVLLGKQSRKLLSNAVPAQ